MAKLIQVIECDGTAGKEYWTTDGNFLAGLGLTRPDNQVVDMWLSEKDDHYRLNLENPAQIEIIDIDTGMFMRLRDHFGLAVRKGRTS